MNLLKARKTQALLWFLLLLVGTYRPLEAHPEEPVQWTTVTLPHLRARIMVPQFETLPSQTLRVEARNGARIQNYEEHELIPGEVPSFRPMQYFVEIDASTSHRPLHFETDCPEPRKKLAESRYLCSVTEDGESAITHVLWSSEGRQPIIFAIGGSALEVEIVERILESATADDP